MKNARGPQGSHEAASWAMPRSKAQPRCFSTATADSSASISSSSSTTSSSAFSFTLLKEGSDHWLSRLAAATLQQRREFIRIREAALGNWHSADPLSLYQRAAAVVEEKEGYRISPVAIVLFQAEYAGRFLSPCPPSLGPSPTPCQKASPPAIPAVVSARKPFTSPSTVDMLRSFLLLFAFLPLMLQLECPVRGDAAVAVCPPAATSL
ncbi:hypothetical protein cyc_06592 [Cyclospora cayetanensis]|uniref:Uncharacterized protein n=1 Tax=Cyclospora cayetanensis TaxID=88456 RepID=A0A1D3CX87_9EIME|nr:hypothetical protein cyc_06592 [Cyclospora cayetanensis]